MNGRALRALAIVLLVGATATAAAAQEVPGVQRTREGVLFDFQGADIRVVLSALADVAGLNIVYGELPSRSVTLRTSRAVPIAEVRALLENVASAQGLQIVEEGGLLRIFSTAPAEGARPAEPQAAARRPATGPQDRRLFVHRLRHARAETIVQTLRALFGLDAPSFGFEGAVGAPSLSEQLRQQQLPPGYRPEPPPTPDEAPAAGRAQGEGIAVGLQAAVDMVPDPLSNSILILATAADYEVLRGAIGELDARPLQVLIEVLIAEVRRDRTFDLGVDVNVPLKKGETEGVAFNLQGLSAGDVALRILGIGDRDASVILRALAAAADVTILSRPILLAQNNQEARILVGDQRPFVQLFRALPTDAAVRDQVVQYRNVGTQLLIRPTINADGYVSLSVLQEVSSATAESQFGAPVINTREAETELLVRDGQTVVLGGLMSHQKETSNSGVPILKDIPLVGLFFRSTRTRNVQTELLLFITPHVLSTEEDVNDATRGLREGAEGLRERLPDTIPILPPSDTLPQEPRSP